MPGLDFMIHLPLLRIEEERLPFGPGILYRMPFEKYNEISLGAFSEQERQYTATELCHRLLGRPASESGRFCHGNGGHEGGRPRRWMVVMSAILLVIVRRDLDLNLFHAKAP
jgi:hypothetical protein